MVGHKFGEFSPTRTFHGHSSDKKAKRTVSMGKAATPAGAAENEAKAVARDAARLAAEAEPRRAAHPRQEGRDGACRSRILAKRIARDVASASRAPIANAENNHDLDVDDLVVAEAFVGKALVMKRFHARARGRGARIQKPFSNLTIVVREVAAEQAEEDLMGQKVNPIGLRLGINRTWDSRWFARKGEYAQLMHEDIAIREALMKQLKQAACRRSSSSARTRSAASRSTRRGPASSSARRAPTSRSCASSSQDDRLAT